jgi:hypothetical protein
MVSSFGVSIFWLILKRFGPTDMQLSTHEQLLYTIAFTTVCWVLTAFIPGLETDHHTLLAFFRKVRPFGPGWAHVREEVGNIDEDRTAGDNIPLALIGWVAGCTAIWSALFTLGNYLYGRTTYTAILGGVFVLSSLVLIRVVNKLWTK